MSYERMYYTIGQLSKISGLPQSVLRYWETVFETLNPPKSNGGTRQYTENDVKLVMEIKKLLYDEGYTIKGANKLVQTKFNKLTDNKKSELDINIKAEKQSDEVNHHLNRIKNIDSIKQRIKSIINTLDS